MKKIPLTQGKFAWVDDEDFDRAMEYKWSCEFSRNTYYGKCSSVQVDELVRDEDGESVQKVKKTLRLHQFIMRVWGTPFKVDHKNGKGWDCRKDNLRVVTESQNSANRAPLKGCASKYKGVTKASKGKRWRATIQGEHIGSYKTEQEAALAYDDVAVTRFGPMARLNFPRVHEIGEIMTTKTKKAIKKPSKTKTQKIKKQTPVDTILSFVLDESGSMDVVKQATISGFNEYLETMKKDKGDITFTLTQFNGQKGSQVSIAAINIKSVAGLNDQTYRPDGGTPLYDAIASTIKSIESVIATRKLEKKVKYGSQAIVVTIMTDGQENSSREYDRKKITDLITAKTKEGWLFTYLGANQDAWAVGQSIGVGLSNSMTYDQSMTKDTLRAAAVATSNYRGATKSARSLISADMAEEGFTSAKSLGLSEDELIKLQGGAKAPERKP